MSWLRNGGLCAVVTRHKKPTERNKEPILHELRQLLPASGLVLEVASGTGQHVAHFAAALPGLLWQPSDVIADSFGSIEAYVREGGVHNVLPPVLLDASQPPQQWPVPQQGVSAGTAGQDQPVVAVLAANVTHISPW